MTATELLTAAEAATRLKIDKRTILRWAREGRIESVKISSKMILFSTDAIESFLKSRTNGVESPTVNHQKAGRATVKPTESEKGGNSTVSRESWRSLRKEVATWQ